MGAERGVPRGAVPAGQHVRPTGSGRPVRVLDPGPDGNDSGGPEHRHRARWSGRSDRARTVLWAGYALMGVLLLGYLAFLIVRGPGRSSQLLDGWLVPGFEMAAAALCIARGLTRRPGRAVALTLGFGLVMWSLGDIALTVESQGGGTPATPSLADVFYLGFYPLAYVAAVIFMRGEVRKLATPSWLDGAVASVGTASVCAAFVFERLLRLTGGNSAATATNLAYPIGDVLLLSLVMGGSTVMSGRRKAPWLLMATGIAVNAAGDTAALFGTSFGASRLGFIFDAMAWPTSMLVLSMAVWLRPRPSNPRTPRKPALFVIPGFSAACALVVLFVGNLHPTSRLALGLATATLLLVGVRLVVSVRGMRSLSQERRHQSVTDELTGLGNRRCLHTVLDAFFADYDVTAARPRSIAFLFLDLNHFKEINDTFGHPVGDKLLKQLGPRLSACLREADLPIRLGGDEFVVVLVDGDADYATAVAQRLTDRLAEPFVLDTVRVHISASIGIALAPTDATDSAGLLWCADVAMYRAKLAGTPFAIYQPDLDRSGNRLLLLDELRTAIDERQLVLHYQPQLDLRTGEIVAVESLLRWAHPRLGIVPPLEFLSLAEEAGLMGSITTLVLTDALAQCAVWRSAGSPLSVSVNISPTNLLDPRFTDLVRDLLETHQVPAEALVLEITETSVISHFDRSQSVIQELRDHGIVVSIDDFGAGFTSLAHLSSLAVKELKLDRIFIARLADGDGGRALDLVRATIDLGHALGLRIVAEGIEDSATLELLTGLGCDLGQGNFISRPMPADRLTFAPKLASSQPATNGR
jgi:diguanylate cyclase (GGDEF)-like protein